MYLIATLGVARRKGWAYVPVLAALGVEVVANVVGRPIVAATGVVVNPNSSAIATVVIPLVLPMLLALVLWQFGRTASPSSTASL